MAFRRAPMALRIPISRVRSVTVTSMMFMIPIPLIASAISAMRINTSVSAVAILPRRFQNARQILHQILRFGAVAAPQNLGHLARDARDIFGTVRLGVKSPEVDSSPV